MEDDKYIVLASVSPRRKSLLKLLGIPFRVIPGDVVEEAGRDERAQDFVKRMSLEKAMSVVEEAGDRWILAADTVVVLDGKMLGKPGDEEDALLMLGELSGRDHIVYSGVSIVNDSSGFFRTVCERTNVTFRKFSAEEAMAYVLTGEPLDKAGSYGAQGIGILLIERIEGSYSNVIGLPLSRVVQLLHEAGILAVSRDAGKMYELIT